MPAPSVTYTFSNSTTADATQINQNYTDLINAMSDGTKDLSISALTCAGTVTLNGAITLGNATTDDITVTGSFASSVPIKTTNTYDIGSATKGLRYIYIGDTADANTHRIGGQALGSDVNITLPSRTGTLEVVPAIASSQTSTYAVLTTDDFVPVSASGGAFTATLPTAVGCAGKKYLIKRTDQTLGTAVTIATTSSQTIDGVTTTTLDTQYEMLEVISDGSNWHILRRHIPSVTTAYTPTMTGFGTVSNNAAFWKRDGDSIVVQGFFTVGTSTAVTARVGLPSGLNIDTGKLTSASTGFLGQILRAVASTFTAFPSGTVGPWGITHDATTTSLFISVGTNTSATMFVAATGSGITSSGDNMTFHFKVPISGWKG